MSRVPNKLAAAMLVATAPTAAFATNGMNLEGYGPMATGMGGASMAYDNGTAAVMNNPATLGLMAEGSRLDLALGILGPSVSSSVPGAPVPTRADSSAKSFFMPAVGWAKKSHGLAYGVGLFAQGGMGTEYSSSSFLGAFDAAGNPINSRSEVSVGRLLFPLAYEVNDKLIVGGTIDYVWAGMDLVMAMNAAGFTAMGIQMSGPLATGLMAAPPAGFGWNPSSTTDAAAFDFSDGSPYTGAAKGNGFAGKIGAVYKVSSDLTVGATYHLKTSLSDLEASGAKMRICTAAGGCGTSGITQLEGTLKVQGFQWPSTFAVGGSYRMSRDLMLVGDVKQINWSEVMKDFRMNFTSASGDLTVVIPQNWKDQTVISLGAAFQLLDDVVLRAGYNRASNPIPDANLMPFFPAISQTHYTFGAGYTFDKRRSLDASVTLAPRVTGGPDTAGIDSSMSQMNWQVMYSQRF